VTADATVPHRTTTAATPDVTTAAAGAEAPADRIVPSDPAAVADSLYYSVSHDLRSPLLTMSLSADLITDALARLPEAAGGPVAVALDAMRHGARDMERMLQALTVISRAQRRTLRPSRVGMQTILGGHLVISDVARLGAVEVAVDPVPVLELLDALAAGGTLEVRARVEGDGVLLDCDALGAVVADPEVVQHDTSPLALLVGSLQHHAGTPVEAMARAQVLLERQGGAVHCAGGRLRMRLPLARTGE